MLQVEPLVKIHFTSHPDQLQHIREEVRRVVRQRGCLPELVECLVLAVGEACMNIIQHGYGMDCVGEIILEIVADHDGLVFRLIDFAERVDESTIKARDLDDLRPGGLGVYFMHEVMDEVEFLTAPEGVGNILEMRKKIVGKET